MLLSQPLLRRLASFGIVALSASATLGATGEDEKAEESTQFVRLTHDENDDPIAMETAINRLVNDDGNITVDLISAIHVADSPYYDDLNKRFETYDAVLYELVAPKGTRVPKGGGRPSGVVSLLQNGMTEMLDLEFQLEGIDYTKRNMVHADISPAEFSKSMKDRGESMVSMFFRAMGHAMAQQADPSKTTADAKLVAALLAKDRDFELKRILAEQFEDMESTVQIFEGPNGSTLVTVRNQRAADVLKEQIKLGRKKIAIFYGAAHMPDLSERLEDQLALKLQGQQWLEAWDLRRQAVNPAQKK